MKILLSAYACEPDRGSEPGVGWNWGKELANSGHDVHVLTRANNRDIIEKELSKNPCSRLQFIYYDLPLWLRWWKKGSRGIRFYYLLWQIGAVFIAKTTHRKVNFDVVHHITFGVVRQPSFMGSLKIPFILGPLGGGDRAPYSLRKSYPIRGKLLDFIRDCLNAFVRIDPLMWYTFHTASQIYARTPATKNVIPRRFHEKVRIQLDIGVNSSWIQKAHAIRPDYSNLKILYVGRFVYLKGGKLAISAVYKALQHSPTLQLTMVGDGPEEKDWKKLAIEKGIEDQVAWIPWVDQVRLQKIYESHHVLLFPSLRDSSGCVVLESLAYGLPVICLDLGGPGVIVDSSCGYKIATSKRCEEDVTTDLANAIIEFSQSKAKRAALISGALQRASHYRWESVVRTIYNNNS